MLITKKKHENVLKSFRKQAAEIYNIIPYDHNYGMVWTDVSLDALEKRVREYVKSNTPKEVSDTEKRLRMLECDHTEWEYEESFAGFMYYECSKVCKRCGKTVYLRKEDWLQEQADLYYKKHEEMIEQLNEED